MNRIVTFPALFLTLTGLAACDEGTKLYQRSPDTVIATDADLGSKDTGLKNGEAAVVYDPDGCQAWLIDDGVEGYAGRRFDPATGLPVCDSKYPPGTVIGVYQTAAADIPDFVPRLPKQ